MLKVYQYSKQNIETIEKYGHEVIFEVDATKLCNYFAANCSTNDEKASEDDYYHSNKEHLFDRIQFNFPHWRGKQNNRRNRQLIKEFFKSATNYLRPGGQIHMGLLGHQSGMSAENPIKWKNSWMPGKYAAESNLLLTHILPFESTT